MFKNKLLNTLILTSLSLPGLALADEAVATAPAPVPVVTSNVALVSDYLYRGISQTGGNPAVQGGFEYTPTSGFYLGTWGSSISWISDATQGQNQANTTGASGLELDTYLGIRNSFATDYSYDVGYLRYNYPGHYATGATKADTDEVYALIGYKWLTAKYSYALSNLFGHNDTKGSTYFDLSASYALGDSGFTLGAHYGIQTYQGTGSQDAAGNSLNYRDYKVSINKDISGYVMGLTYSDSTANSTASNPDYTNVQGYQLGQSVFVASLLHTF